MTLYTDYEERAAPPWATGPNFAAWWQAHGLVKDIVAGAARVAAKAGWPLETPVDGLSFIGSERLLPRVLSDTDDTYRQRLSDAWDLWEFGGTKVGIQNAILRRFPSSNAYVTPYWEAPVAFGVDDARWSRWLLYVTMGAWDVPAKWGSGVRWGDPYVQWGIRAPLGELAELKEIIRIWSPGDAVLVKIVVTTPSGVLEIAPLCPLSSQAK